MNWLRFLRRNDLDAEQRQELESYVEITAEEYIARGMEPEAARRAARRKLGNPTRIREEVYEMNTARFVEGTLRDFRQAVRMLRRNPAFSIAAMLTLALGIGATTAIFSVVNGVLIKPLAYPEPEAVVSVWHSGVIRGVATNSFNPSPQMFASYVENQQAFQAFGVWRDGAATITGLDEAEQVDTLLVTQGILPALGVQPALGRWFSQEDDRSGTPETVILTNGYWQRRFGGDQGVIGRVITVDYTPREVIGVMPADFTFQGAPSSLILPLRFDLARPPTDYSYRGIARLKPGVTLAQANADVARMLPLWMDKYVANRAAVEALRLGPSVRALKDDVVGNVGQVLWLLMGTIGIVLLISCANVANLLLVRAEGRGQELAVRAALGAGWGHIARELMVESVTLGALGGAIGLALADAGLRLLAALGPANLPRLSEISIDGRVVAFAWAVSLLSSLLFGLVPVVKYAAPRLASSLRASGRGASASRSRHRSQDTLVVVQVALALVLLVSSGLMIRSFQNLRGVQPGFTQPDRIQTVRISIPAALVAEPERVTRVQGEILDRLAAVPGVTSVAFLNQLPMEPLGANNTVAAQDKVYGEAEIPPIRRVKFVSPQLFQTLGTRLLAGRDFSWAELYDRRDVALVSESFARETWNSIPEAVGKRIRMGTIGPWHDIIGVVEDVYDDGVDQKPPVIVYWPARVRQFIAESFVPRSVAFTIRSDRTGTESLLRDIRQAVAAVNPGLPLSQVRALGEVYADSMARTSFTLVMLGIAGLMALVLGIIGIYGVLAYTVSQRQREVGIRLALGARPSSVKGMFVRRGVAVTAAGIGIGLVAAAGLSRLMSSLLFGVAPRDPATYTMAAAVLVCAALAASYIPARRAAAVDPIETLRGE